MRGGRHLLGAVATLAIAVGLLLPSVAAAMHGHFSVGASAGYRIRVDDYGFDVLVRVSRTPALPPKRGAWTYYTARASGHGDRVKAKIGDLGRIDMRFVPSGPVLRGRRFDGCTGPDRYTAQRGAFVGSFEFRGEGGYTEARASRARGVVFGPNAPLRCTRPPTPGLNEAVFLPEPGDTFLRAGHHDGTTAQYLYARGGENGYATFSASRYETVGALGILRRALAHGAPASFASDGALSFATLTPPAPFAGVGELRRDEAGARTWLGSLSVSFPGLGPVPLTGPEFWTALTRGLSPNY